MAKATKGQLYNVQLKIVLETDVDVTASSLESALEVARLLGVRDVVEFEGGFNDGSIKVTGVFDNN